MIYSDSIHKDAYKNIYNESQQSTLDISALEKWIEEYNVIFNKFLIDNDEVIKIGLIR